LRAFLGALLGAQILFKIYFILRAFLGAQIIFKISLLKFAF